MFKHEDKEKPKSLLKHTYLLLLIYSYNMDFSVSVEYATGQRVEELHKYTTAKHQSFKMSELANRI